MLLVSIGQAVLVFELELPRKPKMGNAFYYAALSCLMCAASLTTVISSPVLAQDDDCWLVPQGTQIVNASNGEPVVLRSVALGYWLLQEGYMLHHKAVPVARARSGK